MHDISLIVHKLKRLRRLELGEKMSAEAAVFLDSESEVKTSRRREPLRGSQADATICVPTAQCLKACS